PPLREPHLERPVLTARDIDPEPCADGLIEAERAARAHYRGDQHIRELGRDAAIALPSDSLRIDPDVRRAEQIRQKTPRVLQARLDVGVEKLVFRSLHRSFPPRVRAAVRRRIPTTSH